MLAAANFIIESGDSSQIITARKTVPWYLHLDFQLQYMEGLLPFCLGLALHMHIASGSGVICIHVRGFWCRQAEVERSSSGCAGWLFFPLPILCLACYECLFTHI